MTDKYAVPFMLSSRFIGLSLVLGTYAALKAGVDVAPFLETLGLKTVGTCYHSHVVWSLPQWRSQTTVTRTLNELCYMLFRQCSRRLGSGRRVFLYNLSLSAHGCAMDRAVLGKSPKIEVVELIPFRERWPA